METPGNQSDGFFKDELDSNLVEVSLADPMPIFKGAILCSGNNLSTNQHRIIELFKSMQDGEFPYPESMKPKVEDVHISLGTVLRYSKEIELLFHRIGENVGISWNWDQSPTDGSIVGETYKLSDDATSDYLEIWGDDYEALEFYERCADFLAIKK